MLISQGFSNMKAGGSGRVSMLMNKRNRAISRAWLWRYHLLRAYNLSQPNRNLYQILSEGAIKDAKTYDLTLVLATRAFVNRMQNALVPQNINWLQFIPGDLVEDELEDAVANGSMTEDQRTQIKSDLEKKLQVVTEKFFKYLRRSNFDTVINEAFYDLAIGTAGIQINEGPDDNPFMFSSIPIDTIGFNEGPWGNVEWVFRDFNNVELNVARRLWPNFITPTKLVTKDSLYEDKLITLHEISFYNPDKELYETVVIEDSTREIVYEEESESWPFVVFRWYRLPGEIFGRGPALECYPGAATINRAFRDELLAAELKSNPIYMAYTDGIFNPYTFKLTPNTVLPVNQSASGSWPIAPLPSAGDISYTVIVINDLRQQIDKLMYNSPLGPLQETPPMTATEVAVRQNELRENAAASFARLQRELFTPLIERLMYILKKKGKFPPIQVNGKDVDVKYQTPLSLGKGQVDVNQFLMFYKDLQMVFGEQIALGMLNAPKVVPYMAKNLNIDVTLTKDEIGIKEMEDEAKKQAKKMLESQQNNQGMNGNEPEQAAAGIEQ